MRSDVLEGGGLASTCRATAAQTTIKFLKNQYVEREGVVRPFFAGCFGIFGGIGQALQQDEGCLYYLSRNEQAMVHTAVAFSKTACGRSRALLRLVRELPTWYLGCYLFSNKSNLGRSKTFPSTIASSRSPVIGTASRGRSNS